MLCCALAFVVAAYVTMRLTPQTLLRSRFIFVWVSIDEYFSDGYITENRQRGLARR